MRKAVPFEIGFSDGEILYYQRSSDECTVFVKAWNDATLKVVFHDAVGVIDTGVGDISGFVEEDADSKFRDTVIHRLYEQPPISHSYTLYQFLDLDDQPALEVVAVDVHISVAD